MLYHHDWMRDPESNQDLKLMRLLNYRYSIPLQMVSDEGFEPPLPAPKAGALPGYANRRKLERSLRFPRRQQVDPIVV